MTYEMSVLIPSREELFLNHTIQDILKNMRGNTEIIVVLDGAWPIDPIPDDPRVTLIYHPESIGQRAACNEAARVSTAKYVMKLDAHVSVDVGFDAKLLADMQDDWTVVPIMRNLHVYDWVCQKCGERRYQGQTPTHCVKCGNVQDFVQEIVWKPRPSPNSKSYCFDSTPKFAYFGEYSKRPEAQGDLTETMSIQGSCFMMTREKYFELGMNDESFGSWGSQGIEVACKTWLSGGKVIVNHRTFYSHLFRGPNYGFPYPLNQGQVDYAREKVKDLFFNNKWKKQIYPLSWLVEKFWPVRGWSDDDLRALQEKAKAFKPASVNITKVSQSIAKKSLRKGVIFYTDNTLPIDLLTACQLQIAHSINGHELISVSLQPMGFGRNIVLRQERSILSMFQQILAGLEASTADVVFLAEHDVLYGSEHFKFTPPDREKVYYNTHVYHLRTSDGHAVTYEAKRTSQLCAYRDVLLTHYRKRVEVTRAKFEELGDSAEYRRFIRQMGYEAGSHQRKERIDDLQSEYWRSDVPNIDLKHGGNLTPARWSPDQFRDPRNCQGWTESDGTIPGWGETQQIIKQITGVIGETSFSTPKELT